MLISGRAILETPTERLVARPGKPITFAGETEVVARVGRSPAVALNIMSDPRGYDHDVAIVDEGEPITPGRGEGREYLVAFAPGGFGGIELAPGDLVVRHEPRSVEISTCRMACIMICRRIA